MFNRLKIIQDIFKMLQQIGTDLCLTLFLWVTITCFITSINTYFDWTSQQLPNDDYLEQEFDARQEL